MASESIDLSEAQRSWRGIHHLALATGDLDTTIRFYGDVLGMVVSDVFPSREGRGRHCLVFVKPGDNDVWGLHFFERDRVGGASDSEASEQPASEGPLLHIAFRLADGAAVLALRGRLGEAGVPITEIEELGTFIFWDNNGIMLEATWPKE